MSPTDPVLRLAQISDLHLKAGGRPAYGLVDTARALERAVAQVSALKQPVDAVLISGDLGDMGTEAEYYEVFTRLAVLSAPLLVIPGNHDDAERLAAWRPPLPPALDLDVSPCGRHQAIRLQRLHLIGLDSSVQGQAAGHLDEDSLAWLDAMLAAAWGAPAAIMVHHPPVNLRIPHMDAQNLINGRALGAVVQRHPNVKAVLCGHLHRSIQRIWMGAHLSVAPGIAHAVTWDEADETGTFMLEPPAFHLHILDEEDAWTTHWIAIGDFEGPHRFRDEAGRLVE